MKGKGDVCCGVGQLNREACHGRGAVWGRRSDKSTETIQCFRLFAGLFLTAAAAAAAVAAATFTTNRVRRSSACLRSRSWASPPL